ncbi:MAG TPA: methyltransferase domain-containing protein [Gammaproteobacteria bacterium]|nr:methyltransferase domain-containing protein [Gammaproteobacteria bacterium]
MKPEQKAQIAPHPVLPEYYDNEGTRRKVVDAMFDASARHYDWITTMMSFGSGKWYRRQALLRAGVAPGMRLLDAGAGTGVIAHIAQDITGEDGLVVALDPSKGMLNEARKLGVQHTAQGLGEGLPFPDNSFDRVTMGYALRHVADLKTLFAEYLRVLKPGGGMLILEITRPENKLGLAVLKCYLKGVVPTLTRLFRRSSDAQKLMRYYWDTIENCVPPATILDAMAQAGVHQPRRHVVQGIFSEYSGSKT